MVSFVIFLETLPIWASFKHCLQDDKTDNPLAACIRFSSGIVKNYTCTLRVDIDDEGSLIPPN